jgi:K+ transporter
MNDFSTVTYLSRHELGMNQRATMNLWQKKLKSICMRGGSGNSTHFTIELLRVTKFINNLPK